MLNKEILRGWKEIEQYLGMTRHAILINGYPVRKSRTKNVFAIKSELNAFLREKSRLLSHLDKK